MWHENIFQSFKNRTEAEYPEYEHGDFCRHYAGCGTGHPWFYIPDKARLSGGGVHVPGAVHERGLYHLHLRRGPDGAASGGSRIPGTENPQTVPGDAHQPGYAAGGGIYHLCAVCRGFYGSGLSHGGCVLGRKASRQPGGIPWKLAPYPGFHLKHRDDGGRHCEK